MPSVIGLFKRDSIGSTSGSRRGSLQSLHHRMDSPRHSIGSDGSFEMRMAAMGERNGGVGGDVESAPGGSSGTVGVVPRRGSTFLATPIVEVEEETETNEGSRASSSQSAAHPPPGRKISPTSEGDGNTNGGAAGTPDSDAGSPPVSPSSLSPPHSKPTSPTHVSLKSNLEKIGEEDGPNSSADPDPNPHTKL